MNATQFDVQRLGAGHLRIESESYNAEETHSLLVWLRRHGDVIQADYRQNTGAIHVRYRATRSSGAFLRTLRDHLFTLHHPFPQTHRHVDVVHELPGRLRLRVPRVSEAQLLNLGAWMCGRPGVVHTSILPASRSLLVSFDPEQTSARALLRLVSTSTPTEWPKTPPQEGSEWTKTALNTLVLGATASGFVSTPVASVAVAVTAIPSVRRALSAFGEKRLSVDVLDVAAVALSIGSGRPTTAAFITWLLAVGDLILDHTADRARNAISKVLELDVQDAWRFRADGQLERVRAANLQVGDRIVASAGSRIAADGVVVSGEASVDEKALTGESIPKDRTTGDRVMAVSVVVEGQLVIEVDHTGRDTTAAKIVQILEGAGAKPMSLQRETERIADRLVLPTIGLAGAAALLSSQIDRMTSVIITDFGTGIRIAVPTSALASMTLAARQGILLKGGHYLERLAKADTIVFDKTGTLTSGTPEVFEVVEVGGALSIRESIALAAAAEALQKHPVAKAIRRYAQREGIHIPAAELLEHDYRVGMGLWARVAGHEVLIGTERLLRSKGVSLHRASPILDRHSHAGASSLLLAIDGELTVIIGYADAPRPESAGVIRALKAGGRRNVLLMSGDAHGPADAIGRRIGVTNVLSELLPEQKAYEVRRLKQTGRTVAMVGDGINDAPALALADVGVSLDGGTDVALETADVVLLEGGLAKLPRAFDLADAAMRNVHRSLNLVIVPNAACITLGALGLIPPSVAAIINNGSTILAALYGVAPLFSK